jgi:hypothetical protein
MHIKFSSVISRKRAFGKPGLRQKDNTEMQKAYETGYGPLVDLVNKVMNL